MKKLLLLGNNCHVDELIKYAKERGAYTIVTDNLPVEQSPVKKMADEAWDISVFDYDILEKKCKEENVTAILCGASEVCIKANKELCERLNLPFYANEKAWNITNDKFAFKQACVECGLPVPKDYVLDINFNADDLANIEYPVVVKPTDCCSSMGLHICQNEQELIEGYKDAYEKSEAKKVIVEEFVAGEQIGIIYAVLDGQVYFVASGDDCACKLDASRRVFGCSPTKHKDIFATQLEKQIVKLFELLEIKAGVAGIQVITDGEKAAVLEMNYRLPGGKFPGEELLCTAMLDNALGEKSETIPEVPKMSIASYALWLKPGKIAKIEGLDEFIAQPQKFNVQQTKHVGDVVEDNTGMRQILGFIIVYTDSEHAREIINDINEKVKVISDTGEDLLCRYRFEKGYAV